MPEYIEREALLEKAYWHGKLPDFDTPYPDGVEAVDVTDIDEIPAADVVSRATLEQVVWERDVAMEQLKEHGIPFGGKADVVDVVRCGDCERRCKSADLTDSVYCPWLKLQMRKHDFCSYGERRGEDATD